MNWIVAYKWWLWAIPGIVIIAIALWFLWRRIVRNRLSRFVAPKHFNTALPRVSWVRRGIQFAITSIALMLIAFALARPMRGPTAEHAESKGVDFVLALDVSKSMWTEDVPPNRLAAVKKEMGEWIKKMKGDRMGLVLFAGDAMVQAPITFDYVALNHVLQQAGPKSISFGGTNIPKAVEMATHLLKNAEPRSRILVIVSDGENLEGDAVDSIRKARATEGLTVFTIGVGTLQGDRVPDADYSIKAPNPDGKPIRKGYIRNEYGIGVTSRLDSRALRLLAEAGGGKYYEFKPDAKIFETLQEQSLLPLAKKSQKIDLREYEEWFQLPLGIAILLIVATPMISLFRKRPAVAGSGVEVVMPETLSKPTGPRGMIRAREAIATAIAFAFIFNAAPTFAAPIDEAEKLLAAKKNDEAIKYMREAVEKDDKNPYLFYNYAMTLYRAGKYDEAVAAFTALRQTVDLKDLNDKMSLQMGNAQVRLAEAIKKSGQLSGAILSLERAVMHYDETPADKASKEIKNNRKLAVTQLEAVLLEAGAKFKGYADQAKHNPADEEKHLRSALQAYERITEINEKNTEAPKKVQELRERLAKNLSDQAKGLTNQADEALKNEDPKDQKKKQEEGLKKLNEAVAKLDDALGVTPENKPVEQQKKDVQDKISDQLTKMAEQQLAKPLEKPKLDESDQRQVTSAKQKLDEALQLNPENKKAEDLQKQASKKLEESHVDEGNKALANAEKADANPQAKLNQLNKAAEQFNKALENNPQSEPAKKGLETANAKLPDAFAKAGDAEAAKAKDAMAGKPTGKNQPAAGKPGQPGTQDMQKAVGFLEKASQNYGMALSMQPQNTDLQKRADAISEQLAQARDQLDQQNRQALADAPPGPPGPPQEGPPSEMPAGQNADTKRTLLDMSALMQGKGAPNSGDNFWEKQKRDW